MAKEKLGPLFDEVMSKSVSDTWEEAVREWDIVAEEEDEFCLESCVCGHEHLRYLYTIRNRINGNEIYPIGSVCINKFGRDDLDEELQCRRQAIRLMHEAIRLGKGRCVALASGFFSRKLIWYLYEQGAFEGNEYNDYDPYNDYQFLLDMFNARTRTERQKLKVNAVIRNSVYPWLRDLYRETVHGRATR